MPHIIRSVIYSRYSTRELSGFDVTITFCYKEYIGINEEIAASGDGELPKWSMHCLQDSSLKSILSDARCSFLWYVGQFKVFKLIIHLPVHLRTH
jgi:hypothetical protein